MTAYLMNVTLAGAVGIVFESYSVTHFVQEFFVLLSRIWRIHGN
jgi:hypothetical protein